MTHNDLQQSASRHSVDAPHLEVPRFQVVDCHTGRVMGEYGTMRRATTQTNKLDLMYGAVRFVVREAIGQQVGTVYRQDADASLSPLTENR